VSRDDQTRRRANN